MLLPHIILADDHAIVREGLAHLLEPHFEVIATVGDGRALMDQAASLRPAAIVVDIGMPLLNGLEAVRQIHDSFPELRVVILSQHGDRSYVQAAFRLGASAYVLKTSAGTELVQALHEALAGRMFLSHELQQRFPAPETAFHEAMSDEELTRRQREVLQLVAEGKTAKEIAFLLHISPKTVEFHKCCIMDQLGIRTTAELTRYALEHRIVSV